jgi:hypothetical protein
LQQSGNVAARDEVEREVTNLERLCNEIELALRAKDSPALGRAIADSRRTMHAFENAMEAAASDRDAEFDERIFARLRKIYSVREGQMARLRAYHDSIGERLQAISRWKVYARSVGAPKNRERKSLLDDRR